MPVVQGPRIILTMSNPPESPGRFAADRAPSAGWAMLFRPPGALMHWQSLVVMLGLLAAFSAPGFFVFEALGFTLWLLCLAGVWLVRAGLFVIANRRVGRSYRNWRQTWRQWVVCPFIASITLALMIFQVPVRVRFALSRSDLNRLAQQALPAGPVSLSAWSDENQPAQRAGAFDVVVVQVTSGGEVDFRVPGTEFFRSFGGFTYCPTGTPFDPEGSFEPLGGPWYIWLTSG